MGSIIPLDSTREVPNSWLLLRAFVAHFHRGADDRRAWGGSGVDWRRWSIRTSGTSDGRSRRTVQAAIGEHLLNIAVTQSEPGVQPDRMAVR